MRRSATGKQVLAMALVLGSAALAGAQAAAPPTPVPATPTPAADAPVTGGKLHGTAKSGNVPLPGVTITAQNTLTGKRYSTTTDVTGAWSLTIPQNGRYVIRTQFAAFAVGSQEALLNAASHDQAVNFDLMLASRAQQQQARQAAQGATGADSAATQAMLQAASRGAQSLSLINSLSAGVEAQAGASGTSGAALPSIAGNSDFSGDSVAISGQSGQVSPLAGVDMDRIRDAMETMRTQGQQPGQQGGLFGGGGSGFGGGFGGAGGGFGGQGPGGFGFGGGGGPGGGGRGNFRGFNPGQPHGAIFWTGSNSLLNAQPWSVEGQSQDQPESGSNRFGITFMSAPYIPHLTKPSGKDTVFLTLSGQRTSSPTDEYATVPTADERTGDFNGLNPIYDPTTGQQFSSGGVTNAIPGSRITPQATALLSYIPQPNLPGDTLNYHLLTTAQTNTTQAGVRYNRSLGANATQPGARGGGGGRRNQNQGLRQSINLNYNFSDSASDLVNLIPILGGKSASHSNSLQAGYTVGYHKITNIFNVSWNRSNSQTTNFFTNVNDVATNAGILGPGNAPLSTSPLNYGLPQVTLSEFTGLNDTQPSFFLAQTISLSETLSWIHAKHNFRFGGDYRRVHRDFLGGSNATGSFTFTGLFTEAPGTVSTDNSTPTSGSSLADFLLGLPQSTSIDSSVAKSYLRDNVYDAYAQDDWRASAKLTLNYGVRYELYEPYTEKYNHLSDVDTNPGGAFTSVTQVAAGGVGASSGPLPDSLVHPFNFAFAPRIGVALRLPNSTVLRAGFGMNYTVGQYSSFATTMAHQPPFANEQTNEVTLGTNGPPPCAQTLPASCPISLADGFPAPDTIGNYAIDPHHPMPYVEVWNLDVQKRLPWGIVMNLGYNGAHGNHLDVLLAPRATPANPFTNPGSQVFTYDEANGFSKLNAGTVRANKQLTHGISLGINYQYSHSIDDASAVGSAAPSNAGSGARTVQNWQNVKADEGNSTFDLRHQASGTYLYELPFGKDKTWVTAGPGSHILEGFSVSGTFSFATGGWLTPTYTASTADVACGTTGSGRPDRVPGSSITSGGGSRAEWFNPNAFTTPTASNASYPCAVFGSAARNSIEGPGTISNNMSLSKTVQMGDTRSMEIRATAQNVFNTVQYSGIGTSVTQPTFGQVLSAGQMRQFQFYARFRF